MYAVSCKNSVSSGLHRTQSSGKQRGLASDSRYIFSHPSLKALVIEKNGLHLLEYAYSGHEVDSCLGTLTYAADLIQHSRESLARYQSKVVIEETPGVLYAWRQVPSI